MHKLRMATVGFHHASIPPPIEKAKLLNPDRRHAVHWPTPVLLLLLLAALAACKRDTPEAALRAQLADMQAAASERRVGDFMEGIAADFAGNEGLDRAALHNLMRMQLLRKSDIAVATGPLQVEIKGGTAIVRMSAVLAGGNGRLLPDTAQVYSITSGWRLEAGEWRVYYAQWEPGL